MQAVSESDAGHPASILRDAGMLRVFQYNKTLEELDQMDYGRFSRAMAAGRLVDLEARRQMVISGQAKPDSISQAEWDEIDAWDRMGA